MLKVELSIMADVGLVGFPNAGKSSLLDFFTNARPKIAPYPFTTKIPNLGVLRVDDERDIIIADIPGIIEGASDGAGLGIRFLKHISRTACLLYIIDCSADNYLTAFETLQAELHAFSPELSEKPRVILCNKTDIEGAIDRACEIVHQYPSETVIPMSLMLRNGLDRVRSEIVTLVERLEKQDELTSRDEISAFTSDEQNSPSAFDPEFLSSRSCCDEEPTQYPGSEG
jgi:GTP-binding protein